MNYQKIGVLCRKSKCLQLYERGSEQYAGDGAALYTLSGMPHMTEKQLCTFLGVEPEKAIVRTVDEFSVDTSDAADDEILLEHEGLRFELKHQSAIAFFTAEGAICIDSKYLSPFAGCDISDLTFWRRDNMIVVKHGLFFMAAICPIEVRNDDDINKYKMLVAQLEMAKANYAARHSAHRKEDEDV